MARLRNAPSAPPPATNATQPTKRSALREKTNTAKTTRATAKDKTAEKDAGDFVKEAAPRRGRSKRDAPTSDELVMAGGLGQRDATAAADADTIVVEQGSLPLTTDELAKSDGPPPPSAKPNRRPPRMTRKAVHTEAQSKVLDDLKKRMEATAKAQKAKPAAAKVAATAKKPNVAEPSPKPAATSRKSAASNVERSEFSMSPSPPPSGKLHSVQSAQKRTSIAQPGSALRVQGTPAVETSILALKNFMRRPRQGSMLAMVQQRTASARPSLAHTHVQQPDEDPSVFDLDDESEDAEDFEPEAEGTPVQLSKAKKPMSAKRRSSVKDRVATPASASNAKKRKSDGLDSSHSALDALKSKKRKSDPAPADDYLLPAYEDDAFVAPVQEMPVSSEQPATTAPHQPTSDVQVLNSSPESTPPTEPSSSDRRPSLDKQREAVPSTEEYDVPNSPALPAQADEDEDDELAVPNGTMAEPASSPLTTPEPEVIADTQRTDIYADPLTQISPPRQSRRQEPEKQRRKKAAMSTAALQSLLPKRRQKPQPRAKRTEYDISSDDDENAQLDASHLSDDEDDFGGRLRRQTKTTPAKGRKVKGKKALSSARKSTVPSKGRKSVAPSTAKGRTTKTYGRKAAATSDKENEEYNSAEDESSELPDTSLEMHEVAKSRELEEAKRKFAEVDEWDMSFESMSYEDHRSSSQGWR